MLITGHLILFGLKKLPAYADPGKRREVDFQASAEEIARLPHLLSPLEIVELIDIFAWASHAKEQYDYVVELVEAWRSFRSQAKDHPVFTSCVSCGTFLNNLADHGIEAVIESRLSRPSTQADVAQTLKIHEECALSYGVAPRTAQIKAILEKYRGIMHPIVIPYRKLPPKL